MPLQRSGYQAVEKPSVPQLPLAAAAASSEELSALTAELRAVKEQLAQQAKDAKSAREDRLAFEQKVAESSGFADTLQLRVNALEESNKNQKSALEKMTKERNQQVKNS